MHYTICDGSRYKNEILYLSVEIFLEVLTSKHFFQININTYGILLLIFFCGRTYLTLTHNSFRFQSCLAWLHHLAQLQVGRTEVLCAFFIPIVWRYYILRNYHILRYQHGSKLRRSDYTVRNVPNLMWILLMFQCQQLVQSTLNILYIISN